MVGSVEQIYELQKEFLKPIVEELYKKKYGLSGIEIFKALNELTDLTSVSRSNWLSDWAEGKDWIEVDGKREHRYYGETFEYWAEYFIEKADQNLLGEDVIRELMGKLDLSHKKVRDMRFVILGKLGFSSWVNLRVTQRLLNYLKENKGKNLLIGQIVKETGLGSTTVSKYLALFERQNLISKTKGGKRYFYFLRDY